MSKADVSSCTGPYEYELMNKGLLLQLSVGIQSTDVRLNTLWTTINDVISNANNSSDLPFITDASCVYSSQAVSLQAKIIPIKCDCKVYSSDWLPHFLLLLIKYVYRI